MALKLIHGVTPGGDLVGLWLDVPDTADALHYLSRGGDTSSRLVLKEPLIGIADSASGEPNQTNRKKRNA